jgi:hypothetical protein
MSPPRRIRSEGRWGGMNWTANTRRLNFGMKPMRHSQPYLARPLRRALLSAAISLVTACSNPFSGGDCVSLGVFGIEATVTDGRTHQAPSSMPTLRIVGGSYEELSRVAFASNPPQLAAALERPGTYRVLVQAAGYQDYAQENVVVTRGGKCNYLRVARLNVQLFP